MASDNALITYEVSGMGWKKTRQVRGRVTPKRITISSAVWDRNGRRIDKIGMFHFRLVDFVLDEK